MYEIQNIEHKIKKLSDNELDNLDKFLDEIINNQSLINHNKGKLSQTWAGKLKLNNISSIELQKKALVWR